MSNQIVPILMPKWGLTMTRGTLAAWLVDEGAQIAVGDQIMDVETDKIVNAVEAVDAGVLRRKTVPVGDEYVVQALLGVLAPAEVSDAEIDAYVAAYVDPEPPDEDTADVGPVYDYVDTSVGKIRSMTRGDGDQHIILIHGFGGDLNNWLFNIDALAEHATVHLLDLPGHGLSSKQVSQPSLRVMATAVEDYANAQSIDRAHLVGHSMGGAVAATVALNRALTVNSLTLIASAGLGAQINGGYIDGFVNASTRRDLRPVLKNLFADQSLVSRQMVDELLKYKRLDGVHEALSGLANALFAGGLQQDVLAAALASAGSPVQVIWGEQDAIIPVAHANAVANAKVEVIADAGHMVQMEAANQVNQLIIKRLSD